MIEDEIISFMNKNNLDANECADKLGLKVEQIEKIEDQPLNLSTEEQKRILDIIEQKPSTGKRIAKILDLLFRMGACIMALTALLLCINGIGDYKVLIVLLSIGLVCSSIISLPKINK